MTLIGSVIGVIWYLIIINWTRKGKVAVENKGQS